LQHVLKVSFVFGLLTEKNVSFTAPSRVRSADNLQTDDTDTEDENSDDDDDSAEMD